MRYKVSVLFILMGIVFLLSGCWNGSSEIRNLPGNWSHVNNKDSLVIYRDLLNLNEDGSYDRQQFNDQIVLKQEVGTWSAREVDAGAGYDLYLTLTDEHENSAEYIITIVESTRVLILAQPDENGQLIAKEFGRIAD